MRYEMTTGVSLYQIRPPEMWPNLVSFLFYPFLAFSFLLPAQDLLQKQKNLKGENSTDTLTWALNKDLRKGQSDSQTHSYINLLWTGTLNNVAVSLFMQNFLLETGIWRVARKRNPLLLVYKPLKQLASFDSHDR